METHVSPVDDADRDWWSPQSTSGVGPLHQINPVRVKYIRTQVIDHFAYTDRDDPAPLRDLRVADVGCGGGVLSEVRAMTRQGPRTRREHPEVCNSLVCCAVW